MPKENKIKNAFKRADVHKKAKREKEQSKLQRRLEIKKAEKDKVNGAALKAERLAKNIPITLDNTRVFDSSSYLTANPATLRELERKAEEASRIVNGQGSTGDQDNDSDSDNESMPEAGPSRHRHPEQDKAEGEQGGQHDSDDDADTKSADATDTNDPSAPLPPPRILITTSPSPCKYTYQFCDDLKNVFPGGEFFKRPRGRGYEIGRVARWAGKRGYGALIVVNEDHKSPNAITLINLPAGPTAYFKLTSVIPTANLIGHARPTPHSPELILNNFTTLLGNSVGRVFGSLFPPQPQFRGRQVVTLHNQRDFLFFRRHRYMFSSATSAKLQEIGPRFTLKLRWLRNGLPAVTAPDGRAPTGGDHEADLDSDSDGEDIDQAAIDKKEQDDEDEAMKEIGQPSAKASQQKGIKVPALDEEQEYEWKWKISEIYDILTSNWPEISPPSPPSPQEPSSSSGNLPPSQQPLFKPNPPKRYRTTSPDDETDEQMARRLQEEYTGNGRPRRSTVGKNSKPVKKRKVISKARVDSDGEGSGSADETSKKSRRGGGGGGAFNKELILSEPLSDLVGTSRLSRPQVVKHIWDYVKERDLQDPKDRRYILCDEKLSRVFHTERLHMFTMNKVLVDHVRNPDEVL
ncbi:hypothetical protein I350_01315 [Cryptococcus amylolentus CBS 6273]|uniref:Uncharacterized protein n=1 Tax=Cryptococcus amylolentus CBS 6273 TaxID=1296118 RepID=A0A1E3KC95_9TREE|nr:hypothetical protein I350_01315 [Cryptococcus amylolentus CBS 6273]